MYQKSEFSEFYLKTIKFRDQPNPIEILNQLTVLFSKIPEICALNKNLAINLKKYFLFINFIEKKHLINN